MQSDSNKWLYVELQISFIHKMKVESYRIAPLFYPFNEG